MGLGSFFLVPATPRNSRFLSKKQKEFVTLSPLMTLTCLPSNPLNYSRLIMERLERNRPFVNPVDTFSVKEVFASMTSPHVILLFLVYFMGGTNLYGLALFLPS